jgi:hypothetical protein
MVLSILKKIFIVVYRVLLILGFVLSFVFIMMSAWLGFGFFLALFAFALHLVPTVLLPLLLVMGPFSILYLSSAFCSAIRTEASIVKEFGPDMALWVNVEELPGPSYAPKVLVKWIALAGHDTTKELVITFLSKLGLSTSFLDDGDVGLLSVGSILWSRMILMLCELVDSDVSMVVSVVSFYFIIKRCSSFMRKVYSIFFWVSILPFCLLWHVDPGTIASWIVHLVMSGARFAVYVQTGRFYIFYEWLQWRFVSLLITYVSLTNSLNSEIQRYHSQAISKGSKRLIAHFRQAVMQATIVISDLALPSFVRKRFSNQISPETLQKSMEVMEALGWPVNVNLQEEKDLTEVLPSFKEWILCGSDFEQGIHNCKTYVDTELQFLRASELYRRSEEYASEKNELEATSRYFTKVSYDFPDISIDDIWLVVGDIFRNSRLTSFGYIISKWEKKYGLGSFFRDSRRKMRKLSRRQFIKDINGYGPFKRLWASTFAMASQIIPVAAVSVKGEALPERKWAKDLVRTVVGSPISQYILSTIWNYGPNHRFAWESTPIKVGMPLNGYWMSTIWQRHARCQIHVEGDFKSFDSTISGKVVEYIKAVRKKGYEHHRDRDRIAELIDINYEQVVHQLLHTTSNGNIYLKGTGLTTGHSSTTSDNSLGLVTLYLLAWKDITGLSAKEFLFYNELSCYGDDHVLSILATKPAVWTPGNIQKCMARWGLTNNLEVKPSLYDVTFLSKHGRKANSFDLQQLKAAGIKDTFFIVWHDKAKLLGKLTSPTLSKDPGYRLKRLMSYLSLTAHHPDVHAGIQKVIESSRTLRNILANEKKTIPSYTKVLQDWYSASSTPPSTSFDESMDELQNSGKLVEYGSVNAFDSIIGSLSMVPDLLSPLLFNYGYMKALQVFLRKHLAWVIDLITTSNNVKSSTALSALLQRTPYRFIDPSLHVPGGSFNSRSALLLKHWLFLLYVSHRKAPKWGHALNFIISKVGSLQFILNAHMFYEQRQAELQIDLVAVCALLDFIPSMDWFGFIMDILLPDIQLAIDLVEHFLLVSIWAAVPPNFREITQTLRVLLPTDKPVVVSAPTGTGKSTAFVQHLYNVVGHKYHKIVVIEPRTSLVIGLVEYLEHSFGLSVSGSTTGLKLDSSKKVLFMTPQALLGHVELLNDKNLFMLDEAHIQEHWYDLLKEVLRKCKVATLYTTATPTERMLREASRVIDIPIAKVWTTTTSIKEIQCHPEANVATRLSLIRRAALEDVNALPPSEVALVFLPRVSDVMIAQQSCTKDSFAICSSTGLPSEFKYKVYFTTALCDVGITIPGVSYVWTSTVADFDGSHYLPLTKELALQRSGRTGRTNNGVFVKAMIPFKFNETPRPSFHNSEVMKTMILEGMPVEVGMLANREVCFRALGFNIGDLPDQKIEDVTRGLCVFYNNFQPVFRGLAAASQSDNGGFGAGVVLTPTGVGNIALNHPQPGDQFQEHLHNLAQEVIEAGLSGKGFNLQSPNYLALRNIAGPILAIPNLVQTLVEDLKEGVTFLLNPSLVTGGDTYSMSDVYECGKILSLLNSI